MPPPTGNCTQPRPAVNVRIRMFVSIAAVEADVAEAAAVRAAGRRLQLGDDLHRPHLRRPGHRPAGERGPQQVERRPAPAAAGRAPPTPGDARSGTFRPRRPLGTRTEPYSQTRPRSLRSRSTIMTFSARSFGLASRSRTARRLPPGVRPRGRVPLIGRVSTSPVGDTCRNRSGDAETIWKSPRSK